MTPILLWFGIPPQLIYYMPPSLKWVAFVHHHRKILITITGWLSLGSVPAALVTLWVLHSKTDITAIIYNKIQFGMGATFYRKPFVQKETLGIFSETCW
jgi:hypothetical protein